MKGTIALFLVFIFSNLFGQIPNSSFENWTDMGTYSNPDSWGTLNNKWAPSTIFTATQGSPGNPSLYYLKLTSKTIGPTVKNGTAVSGILDSMNVVPISGFAFTGQPEAFTGQWQHMIFGSSQGHITVVLTKWNSSLNVRDTIAKATQTLEGMAMNWESFSIPFDYYNLTIPDSCIIFMQASGSSPYPNDYLWVDDLAFSGTVGIQAINFDEPNLISVFPNPIIGNTLTISIQTITESIVSIKLFTISGELIFSESQTPSSNQIQLNLGTFSEGIYYLKVIDGEKIYDLKIVK